MPSLFASKRRIRIDDDEGNTIWIKEHLNFGDEARYRDTLIRMRLVGNEATTESQLGTAEVELFKLAIVDWSGPDFTDPDTGEPVPYRPELIDELRTLSPLFMKVRAEIDKRNRAPEEPEKKALTSTGALSSADALTGELITSRSGSSNGTTGRRVKSVS